MVALSGREDQITTIKRHMIGLPATISHQAQQRPGLQRRWTTRLSLRSHPRTIQMAGHHRGARGLLLH